MRLQAVSRTYKAAQTQPIVQAQFTVLQSACEKSQANDDNAHSWYCSADRQHLLSIVIFECEYALTSRVCVRHILEEEVEKAKYREIPGISEEHSLTKGNGQIYTELSETDESI